MAHKVTCVYCKKIFDRDKFPFSQVSNRRYAHKECADRAAANLKQEEKDRQDLYEYLNVLFKGDYNYALVNKNIKTFIEENGYTYSGIKKALVYFYEVKGNSIEKANKSIGIVPYIYKDAYNYYYAIWETNQKNQHKLTEKYVPVETIVRIPIPERKIKKRKLFSFLDEEED